MKQLFGLLFLFLGFLYGGAQVSPIAEDVQAVRDSLTKFGQREVANDSLAIHNPTILDYKFWTEKNPKPTIIDTVLTIESLYNQNFTQKDVFGKMFFPNFGQTFNPLSFEVNNPRIQLLPTGKSFNYLYAEDIKYYDVKTPTTEFIYENGLREGQYLSTTFSHNLTPRLNYTVRYRGLRSVGRYQNNLAANNAFIANISYRSKNERLRIWTHFISQNIDNEENAGIQDLNQFVNDKELGTKNRQNISVNLDYTDTEFDARRFHFGAGYGFFGKPKTDSTEARAPLRIKNVFSYEKQKYLHRENQAEDYYQSPIFEGMGRRNLRSFETLQNTSTLEFTWGERLLLEAGFRYENLRLYSPEALQQGLVHIPKQLDDQLMGAVAKLYFDWNEKLKLNADAEFKSGEFFKNQYNLNATLDIQPLDGYHIIGGFLIQSAYPSLNLIYNQSFYKDFNYYNIEFENTNTTKLFGKIDLSKLKTDVEANFYNIGQYVYIANDFRPRQLDGNISLFQIKANNLIAYKKINLRTTLEYQKLTQNEAFLPLPDLIARGSLYWQSKAFNNKAELQIGVNATYFSKFESREFFPIINEFMLQREDTPMGVQKIGGFPIMDFFINVKVDRMRIYFRADHFNTLWGERNYYSAPYTPFRDFKIQMGVKWYLFT